MSEYIVKKIAHIENNFKEKFAIPRQSGLVNTSSKIIFNKEYSDINAFRGLEEYSHLWVLWIFSENINKPWKPTVRPPRLGGNIRKGVFATRSPFRPNNIGISVVTLNNIYYDNKKRIVLDVNGADMLDGTPIIDIKPYIPYADSYPDAKNSFALSGNEYKLSFSDPNNLLDKLSDEIKNEIIKLIIENPKPQYQNESERIYTFKYNEYDISFKINDNKNAELIQIKNT